MNYDINTLHLGRIFIGTGQGTPQDPKSIRARVVSLGGFCGDPGTFVQAGSAESETGLKESLTGLIWQKSLDMARENV
jgi:hypothetical protein